MLFFFFFLLFTSLQPPESSPLDDGSIYLTPVEIQQYGLSYVDSIFIDRDRLLTLMKQLEGKVYKAPINARMTEKGIIPEKNGFTLDRRKFQEEFFKHYYRNLKTKLNVPVRPIFPKVDQGLLREISERQLGSYSTYYKPSNKERSHNIVLAAKAIDNTVVFPGETFSFNETVGERTKERGYKRAPVIVKGELAEDIGGGICQVSSTLFNAADIHGIQMIERYTHSRKVPYVPPGRDATVSWWGPDFVFRNMFNEPILIRARAKDGIMSVAVYTSETAEYFSGKQ